MTYRDPGSISSISEGYIYTYFASSNGGIYRFHNNGNFFDHPISMAQGLKSQTIHAVHFDKNTGILWAGLPEIIQYTYTREGQWNQISFSDLGLSSQDRINAIGSSPDYLWVKAKVIYLKLDRSSGILLGQYPFPDEGNIQWSSEYKDIIKPSENLWINYSVMSNWMWTGQYFIDPYGRNVDITTFYLGKNNDIWLGGSDGTLFLGDHNMEVLFPYAIGPLSSNFSTISKFEDEIWLAGPNRFNTSGVTRMFFKTLEFDHYESDITINMYPMNINDILNLGDNIFFAGDDGLQLYDKDDDYWRFLGAERGIPIGKINTLAKDNSHLWLGGINGLARLNLKKYRNEPSGIEDIFDFQNIQKLFLTHGDLWIATWNNLYIFDTENPELKTFKDKGYFTLGGPFTGFNEIVFNDGYLYIASNQGILSFDYDTENWTKIIDANVYAGKTIESMAISGKYCFLGFRNKLIRIDILDKYQKEYDFPFLGTVKDLYISGQYIYLATTEGLTKFKWTVDR